MFRVALTDDEERLYELVFASGSPADHSAWLKIKAPQARLFSLLSSRKAIPSHRLNWFLSSDHNVGGRGKSRKEIYERNGTSGKAILEHPNFWLVLKYLVDGPSLPNELEHEFHKKIKDLGQVSSGDLTEIRREAKRLCREFSLTSSVADEFYKLGLEVRLPLHFCESVYSAIKEIR